MRRASAAHGEHEKRIGAADPNWPDWYAAYMVAEQSGTELPKGPAATIVVGAGQVGLRKLQSRAGTKAAHLSEKSKRPNRKSARTQFLFSE